MSDTPGLVAFIEARLAEDEQIARAATPGPWRWNEDGPGGFEGEPIDQARRDEWGHQGPDLIGGGDRMVISSFGHDADGVIVTRADADHIARHDPARVLADVQAKRKIIEQYVEQHNALRQDIPDPPEFSPYKVGRLVGLKMAVQMLASAYADHPDYQQAWSL